jgi:hypothetical protein
MRTKFLSLIAGLLFASILSGCGGSSSSGQSVSTGVYKDAGIVSGLQYKTATQSGVTDSNGSFKYFAGETVTFSVSNMSIGQSTGAPIVTTFDLVGIAPPTSSFGIPTNNPTSKKFQEAINISLFLQTLDDDSDPTNGIAIPAVVNSVVAANPLDFKITTNLLPGEVDQTWYNFQDSPQFKVFIGSCRAAGAWGGTKAIKQLGYAANSLYQGLGITPSVYLVEQNTQTDGSLENYEYINSGLIYKQRNNYSRWTFAYNTDGDATSEIFEVPSNRTDTTNIVYDVNGNPKTILYADLYNVTTTHFEYDMNGNKTKESVYFNGADSPSGVKVYSYNPNGTLAILKDYDQDNQLLNTTRYYYNNSFLITSRDVTNGGGTRTYVQTYDESNNVIKLTESYGTDVREYFFIYDSFGNLITQSFYFNTVLQVKNVFTWDSNGYPVSTKTYDADNQLLGLLVGTYDSNGSLVRVVQTGDITRTSTRTFINQSGWGDLPGKTVDWIRTTN